MDTISAGISTLSQPAQATHADVLRKFRIVFNAVRTHFQLVAVDRRQVELSILPLGLDLLGQVPGPFEGVLPAALRQLPEPTLERLDADLAELIRLLKADESAGNIPLAQIRVNTVRTHSIKRVASICVPPAEAFVESGRLDA